MIDYETYQVLADIESRVRKLEEMWQELASMDNEVDEVENTDDNERRTNNDNLLDI